MKPFNLWQFTTICAPANENKLKAMYWIDDI